MEENKGCFCFGVDRYKFAIPLKFVDRVIMAVEIKPAPDAFPLLNGFINYHGEVIPVLNFRYKTGLGSEEIKADHYLLLINASKRRAFIIIETLEGVCHEEDEIITPEQLYISMGASGMLKRDGELYYIYDPDLFFSSEEQLWLDAVAEQHLNDHDHDAG